MCRNKHAQNYNLTRRCREARRDRDLNAAVSMKTNQEHNPGEQKTHIGAVYSLQTRANEKIKHTWGTNQRNYKELQTGTGNSTQREELQHKKVQTRDENM